jgi:hypothetical protein
LTSASLLKAGLPVPPECCSHSRGLFVSRRGSLARHQDCIHLDHEVNPFMAFTWLTVPASTYTIQVQRVHADGRIGGDSLNMAGDSAMAKKVAKGGKTMNAVQEERLVKGVRLDLSPADHKRLEKTSKERGLTMASYARMALFERLKADEAGGK